MRVGRLIGLCLVTVAGLSLAARPVDRPSGKPPVANSAPQAPAFIRDRIAVLGAGFDGQVGIAVRSVDDGWQTGWRADEFYPQQSVSKLWVAITAMDAVDRGKIRLKDPVTLTRSDMTLFHQPIATAVLANGSEVTTLGRLLNDAITMSDNMCNDRLMRAVGRSASVRTMIVRKRLGAIRFYYGERALQSKIAGLHWRPDYSIDGAFEKARDALPLTRRRTLLQRYIDHPDDGAAPAAVVRALARLQQGRLLSPASTALLLATMGDTKTGANRLKGGLEPGWLLSHKTGTGQILGDVQAGYNDIGLITAPDGRSYAVAVMIKQTATPLAVRMTLMNDVTRAVIRQHDLKASERTR